uniref:Uncharacterized protein n=1 Tax=Candidatus Methanogaster sp. ANME-2c ERB4 TaxID=2759911 RepID=A0A7G9Y3H4_9EURY|nr:hypothetical protein MMHALIEK_00034 [Methanosarcinales archaeon ANME-2c ERB4]
MAMIRDIRIYGWSYLLYHLFEMPHLDAIEIPV